MAEQTFDAYRGRLYALQALKKIIKGGVNRRRYFYRRGNLNLSNWNWGRHAQVCQVVTPSFQLRRRVKAQGEVEPFYRMLIHLHLAVYVGDRVVKDDPARPSEGLLDGVLDDLAIDAETILHRLEQARDDNGDNIVQRIERSPTPPEAVELQNEDFGIQGLQVSFVIHY